MIVTEAEARDKWCPFARVSIQGASVNRDEPTNYGTPCIGSRCMAWRWVHVPLKDALDGRDKSHGYCGLVPRIAQSSAI